ncbi:MAG: hypothetical protein U9R08_03010 [Nanoarchaeota archaeon]|nr:hypothetical protein [Nanoarchaeota archaeon]
MQDSLRQEVIKTVKKDYTGYFKEQERQLLDFITHAIERAREAERNKIIFEITKTLNATIKIIKQQRKSNY